MANCCCVHASKLERVEIFVYGKRCHRHCNCVTWKETCCEFGIKTDEKQGYQHEIDVEEEGNERNLVDRYYQISTKNWGFFSSKR